MKIIIFITISFLRHCVFAYGNSVPTVRIDEHYLFFFSQSCWNSTVTEYHHEKIILGIGIHSVWRIYISMANRLGIEGSNPHHLGEFLTKSTS